MIHARVSRLVSGGQSGADRAALDVAVAQRLPYGGWCPRGGWAEDLVGAPGLLACYPGLRETRTSWPDERTVLNVRDSHATLVVRRSTTSSPGSDLTVRTARELARPVLVTDPQEVTKTIAWLEGLGRGLTLNVAGPRESEAPGIHAEVMVFLDSVLTSGAASE